MKRISLVVGVLVAAFLLLAASAAQEPYRVFVAPVAATPVVDFELRSDGPTRHEYVMHFRRRECAGAGIVPTSREDIADFTAWFEYQGSHYVLLWDAHGDLIGSRNNVLNSGNIVKDVCNFVRDYVGR